MRARAAEQPDSYGCRSCGRLPRGAWITSGSTPWPSSPTGSNPAGASTKRSNPRFDCHQTGGGTCPARSGADLYSAVADLGPCVAPHPSSLAVALLAHGAGAEVHGRADILPVAGLYGDGSDPTRDHLLARDEVLLSVTLPAPRPGECAAHHRTTAREAGEWPLVEAVARLVTDRGAITFAAVAVGGIARTPLRLDAVEAALTGREAVPDTLAAAAGRTAELRTPGATGGRARAAVLGATVLEVLERAVERGGGAGAGRPARERPAERTAAGA